MYRKNRITRREFLRICAKGMGAVVLWEIFSAKAEAASAIFSGKKEKIFAIPVKPFRRQELYRKHHLAG